LPSTSDRVQFPTSVSSPGQVMFVCANAQDPSLHTAPVGHLNETERGAQFVISRYLKSGKYEWAHLKQDPKTSATALVT